MNPGSIEIEPIPAESDACAEDGDTAADDAKRDAKAAIWNCPSARVEK